jgi:hypothetical protein
VCIAAGHAVWQAEQRLCARHPHVWPLHVVWHLLSCLGGVFAIVHNVFLRREKLGGEKQRHEGGAVDMGDLRPAHP